MAEPGAFGRKMGIEPKPMPTPDRSGILLGIVRRLGEVQDESALYRALHHGIAEVLPCDAFYLLRYDPARARAHLAYWSGNGGYPTDLSFEGGEAAVLPGGVLETGDSVLQDPVLQRLLRGGPTTPLSAKLSTPLRHGHRTLGALCLLSRDRAAFGDSDLELLEGFADLAAIALEQLRASAEAEVARRGAERMEEIVRTLLGSLDLGEVLAKVAETALELSRGNGAVVWLLEEGRASVAAASGETAPRVGTQYPLEGELVRILLGDRRPVVLGEVSESPLLPEEVRSQFRAQSALIVPLVAGDGVLGALSVGSLEPRFFSDDDTRLLTRLANHGAVAIQNARLHSTLQALSLTDPLTRLPNRRHLELHLEREFAAARRGRRLSVVLFDLNDFKPFNDHYGHLAGDAVLQSVGEVLSGETRAMNLVARYGGDEFLAVLSDTPAEGARQHADRVAEKIRAHPGLGGVGVSVSSGIAEFVPSMRSVLELVGAADRDLYRVKGIKNGA